MGNKPIMWLKDRRVQLGLTTYRAAALSGISQGHYSMIENGSRGVRIQTAKRIAKALDFEWTRFYEEEPDPRDRGGQE